jgi:hypothetical protein
LSLVGLGHTALPVSIGQGKIDLYLFLHVHKIKKYNHVCTCNQSLKYYLRPVSSTNKTDITEILFKVVLNTLFLTLPTFESPLKL